MKLSVSILNSKDKNKTITKLNNSNIDYYHIDVMDGIFVSQKAMPLEEISQIISITNKPLDVHLMVDDPLKYIEYLGKIDLVTYITFHLEINKEIMRLISQIKTYNKKVGLSVKPNTNLDLLKPYLPYIDLILIMTVEPGCGGQTFLTSSIDRILIIKQMVKNYNIKLEVDGGINDNTIKLISDVDIAVVGSYITTSDDPLGQIEKLSV